MCLCRFVAFRVSYRILCCLTKRYDLLSHMHLRVRDQSWQTGPNDSVSHFKVVFEVC